MPAVPDGASFLASLCSSMISARGKYTAACCANRIISTAPIEKFAATKRRSPFSSARPCRDCESQPVVPTTHDTPCSSAVRTFAGAASGIVKSTAASSPPHVDLVADLEAAHLVSRSLEHRDERAPDLPVGSEEGELHLRPPRARRGSD